MGCGPSPFCIPCPAPPMALAPTRALALSNRLIRRSEDSINQTAGITVLGTTFGNGSIVALFVAGKRIFGIIHTTTCINITSLKYPAKFRYKVQYHNIIDTNVSTLKSMLSIDTTSGGQALRFYGGFLLSIVLCIIECNTDRGFMIIYSKRRCPKIYRIWAICASICTP